MQQDRKYANLFGDKNPMRRPEVAAKQAASLSATMKAAGRKPPKVQWTPEMRKKQSERAKQQWSQGNGSQARQWTEERKLAQSKKMRAYWDKVNAALAAVGESQHGYANTTNG